MRESKRVSLGSEPEHEDPPWERRVSIDGRPTSAIVEGITVAAEFSAHRTIVLLIGYDHFDGENFALYALREDGRTLDALRLPEQSGFLVAAIVEGEDRATFAFHGVSQRWRMRLDEVGFWSFAWGAMKPRTMRFLLARRHLTLACEAA